MAVKKIPGVLRTGRILGKYRVGKRIAHGGFAEVYRAYDTVEGLPVALKVPKLHLAARGLLDDFRKEVRLTARLAHPNILPIKNADLIDGHFVIVYPLGERTLADRLRMRLSLRTVLDYAEQILNAVAHAHERRVIHCDIKPENFVLFDHDQVLRLGDFGIGRIGFQTMMAGSGSGTVGYLAPEQAMGQLSFRSDVFSVGLLLYRMFSGYLPEWPFEWPPPGCGTLRRRLHPEMIALLRRAMQVNARKRFANAKIMRDAFLPMKRRMLNAGARRRRRPAATTRDWKGIRWQEFRRRFGAQLETRFSCDRCDGPVSETMQTCPWCGTERHRHRGETRLPAICPRCGRGVKLDWTFCPWCYGPGVGPLSDREYPDRRYTGRCANPGCSRKVLMPFMRYCPWCHRKVRKRWKIEGTRETCHRCGWGVLGDFWEFCPWCGVGLRS